MNPFLLSTHGLFPCFVFLTLLSSLLVFCGLSFTPLQKSRGQVSTLQINNLKYKPGFLKLCNPSNIIPDHMPGNLKASKLISRTRHRLLPSRQRHPAPASRNWSILTTGETNGENHGNLFFSLLSVLQAKFDAVRFVVWALALPCALFGYFVPFVHLVG